MQKPSKATIKKIIIGVAVSVFAVVTICMFIVSGVRVGKASKFTLADRPQDGVTSLQPFNKGTGGSENFRIPAMVTLDDGTIISAIDARWNHTMDSAGIDTLVSVSRDGGNTWTYTFANHFGDFGNEMNLASTCFIDPALATDGTRVYMLVDVYPSGYAIASSMYTPMKGETGFDDQNRLLLRSKDSVKVLFGGYTYPLACHNADYDFYLDYTDDTKSAYGVYVRNNGQRVDGVEVDLFFNVTYTEGSEVKKSNLFFASSPYQVYPTGYLYMTSTTDGLNWSAPTLVNLKDKDEKALLLGPGRGVYDVGSGRTIFTAYYHQSFKDENASLIWMDTDGNWHRSENATVSTTCSEASAVVLDDGTVRMFYRDGAEVVRYTDYTFDSARGNYFRNPNATEVATTAVKTAGCELSAIMYKHTYGGKQWIFLSTPTAGDKKRENGVIHGFVLEDDGSMTLVGSYEVKEGYFAYSCLTELNDGHLAILYESGKGAVTFEKINVTWFWDKYNQMQEG